MSQRLFLGGALLLLTTALAPTARSDEGRIVIVLSNLRSRTGVVRCNLWAGAEGYPTKDDKIVARATSPIDASNQARCEFAHVPPGDYAFAGYHDENDNGTLDLGRRPS